MKPSPPPISAPNLWLKKWFYRLLKVSAFSSLFLVFYLVYLDAWVQTRMAGPKWDSSVKVYARPLQLYPNLFLPPTELVHEFKLLGYKRVNQVTQPGEFSVYKQSMSIYRREYMYLGGSQSPKRLRVGFNNDRVVATEHQQQGQWQAADIISLEPMLISRQNKGNEDRDIIDLSRVPEWMVDTLLVVEDRNFYHHYGVSPVAIVRALVTNIMAGRKVQGGSTITQQLAKNLLLNDSRKTYLRKFNEALIALLLDYNFSKDDILQAYFNEIYLGQDGSRAIHGFALASDFYFQKPLHLLQQHEFALLVSLVKGPSYYDPERYSERAKSRRDLVLQLMVSENLLTTDEYAYFINKPLKINKNKTKGRSLFPSYMQLVERELKQLDIDDEPNPDPNIDQSLLVFTGLDPLLQRNHQKAFANSISKLEKQFKLKQVNGAVISVDLDNGAITALVGDKQPLRYGFNRALDSKRNIGSLIKPAIYLTALEYGQYHLGSKLTDKPIVMKSDKGKEWRPLNFNKTSSGEVMMFDALTQSLNLPTVHLGLELGINNVIARLRQLGVESAIPNYPSMLLGAVPMSPIEVSRYFQPIASYGQKFTVSAIQSVTDSQGYGLWQKQPESKEVINYANSYVLNHALQQVTRVGTAKRLSMYYPKVQYAGKTGTTDDLRDSWFVGFDQNRLTTVWIGKDDNSSVNLTGSQGALKVFMDLQVSRKAESIETPKPNEVEIRAIDKATGEVLSAECGDHQLIPIVTSSIGKVIDCPSLFDWFD